MEGERWREGGGGRERGIKWEGGEGGGVWNLNLKSDHAVRGAS